MDKAKDKDPLSSLGKGKNASQKHEKKHNRMLQIVLHAVLLVISGWAYFTIFSLCTLLHCHLLLGDITSMYF